MDTETEKEFPGKSEVGKFKYWKNSTNLLDNTGPLFIFLSVFFIFYIICKILLRIETENEKFNEKIKKKIYFIINEYIEFRFLNDIWSYSYQPLVFFIILNINQWESAVSGTFTVLLAIFCFLTPLIYYKIITEFKDKPFDKEKFKNENLETRLRHEGYKFRSFFFHLNPNRKIFHLWYPVFFSKKIFLSYALIYYQDQ